jgi:hypothetical protein
MGVAALSVVRLSSHVSASGNVDSTTPYLVVGAVVVVAVVFAVTYMLRRQ